MVTNIGLRVERLLYFGFILIVLCCGEVYLAATAQYFSQEDTSQIDSLINELNDNKTDLTNLYNDEHKTKEPTNERDRNVARLRRKLNLPPETNKEVIPPSKSYHEKLNEILFNINIKYPDSHSLDGVLDSSLSPNDLIKKINIQKEKSIKESAAIFGIETPRLFSFQYGSTDFKIPSQYLATAFLYILYPISLIWLGSFYLTRYRELAFIMQSDNYKITFPHILNWFVVDSSSLLFRKGRQIKKKEMKLVLLLLKISIYFFRFAIVLMIESLILVPCLYSTFLVLTSYPPPIAMTAISILFLLLMLIMCMLIITQELDPIKNKTFYE